MLTLSSRGKSAKLRAMRSSIAAPSRRVVLVVLKVIDFSAYAGGETADERYERALKGSYPHTFN